MLLKILISNKKWNKLKIWDKQVNMLSGDLNAVISTCNNFFQNKVTINKWQAYPS